MKEFLKKLTDIIYVNFLWLLVSFLGLLITTGAATTALFRVIFQIMKKHEPTNVLNLFVKSFKENFLLSTLVWLVLIIIGIPLFFMYHYALSMEITWLLILAIVSSYQVILFLIYVFPTIALFKTDKHSTLIKNVLLLQNKNLWTNFKLLGSMLFVILLILFVHNMFLLLAVGLYGVLISFHLKKVFLPYLKDLGEIDEEEGI